MKKTFITIIVSLYCANICAKQSPSTESKPVSFISKIVNIDFNKTAISSDLKLLLADRYYFKDKTPCNTNTLSARAESMGLTTEEYINKIRSLRPAILDDRYFYLTVDQCDAGGTPMLTGIELCTEALCGAEYMKRSSDLWLDDELQPTVKRQATTVVHMPLPYDKEKKLWKVTGWYLESSEETGEVMQSKQIAFEGYTNEENFANRQHVSAFKSFYESGNLKSIYHYNAQNKRDGKAETYFDEKDKIAETLTFKDGQPEGEYIVYHENGAVESKRYFAQGKIKDGECPHFYDNGVLKQKHSYLNQKLEGPAFEYFPDGKIKGKYSYSKGTIVGTSTEYYSTGKIRGVYHRNNQGENDGTFEQYSEEGKLLSKATYKNGKQLSAQSWYGNGHPKEESSFDSEGRKHGAVKEWFSNGKPASSKMYKHDVLDGDSEKWYENGHRESVYPYKNGMLNGDAKHWNEQGKLTYTTEYKDDKKQGADRRWSERTGKLVEEVMFANDERNGLKREFNDRTGKVLSALPYVDGDKEGTEEAYDEDGIKYIRCYHNDKELSELYAPTDVTNKAKQGDSTAQYHLGKYEFECTNYDAAMKWLTQSAEQNHPGALLFLAYAYNDGDGVAQDSKKYLSYLFKAAELGESDAQLEVGYLNLIGEGMPKNLPEAYKWIKKSADQGNARAHYNLGLMYRNGDGVEKDLNKAKLHLTAAVKGGVKPALAALKELTPQTK